MVINYTHRSIPFETQPKAAPQGERKRQFHYKSSTSEQKPAHTEEGHRPVSKYMSVLTLVSFLLLTLTAQLSAFEVTLKFPGLVLKPDAQGHEVPTAVLGEAFNLDIEVTDAPDGIESIEVAGLEPFRTLSKSIMQSSTNINGKQSTTHTIRQLVKCFKAGTYTLGPIKAHSGSASATSGEFFCQVEAKSQSSKDDTEKSSSKPAMHTQALEVELIPSKTEMYWGEQFEVTIRYIAHDQIYQLLPEIPEQGSFFKKDTQNKGWRQILRNGAVSKVYEQVITFLPVKVGATAIGPMKIHYSVPIKQQQHHMGFEQIFNMAFGPQAEQKETEAPSINVTVKPLPKTKKQVSLVGTMTGFEISVDKPTVQVNEPIKLTINITGRGNLEFTEELPLELPAGCKVFKAKTSMHEGPGKGVATKTIEYVLQVNKSGRVEFPAQQLTYFDPEASAYKTLSSQPIELFLTGDAVAQPTKTVDELAREVSDDRTQEEKDKGHIFIFEDAGSHEVSLTWWLLLLMMLLPLGLYARDTIAWLDKRLLQRFKKQPKAQDLIKQAEKELASLVARGNASGLYQFFIKLLATLWQLHEQEVTEHVIEQRLAQLGWADDRIREFLGYLQTCASLHFTRQVISADICEMLLKKSQYWVLLLGK